ncbi:MAG: exosortase A [Novosphingobium sp.]|nr:exosortase A [Novosphingobium sp.]
MPPDAILAAGSPRWDALPHAWRAPLGALVLAWVGLIALFGREWRDMAAQWWDISTYNHVLLVPAILAWLVALRRRELARLTPQAWGPGLLFVAAAALLWVLGSFAGVSLARQLGAVAMLQGATLCLLGPRVAAGLAFPLGYMLFLVPAGEELVPLLQLQTARMTMALLALSGIPALLDGIFITTQAGYFKVAEACSGIKFLIAMTAFAALAANLCFRSWPRRVGFVAGALTISVLANGVRAWGTIVVAEVRGIEFAAGFDHILYGWLFFAAVIVLVLAAGWRWFDRAPADPPIDARAILASKHLAALSAHPFKRETTLIAIAALALGAFGWAAAADRLTAPLPAAIDLPDVPGWQRADYAPAVWWEPRHRGADHRLLGRYANAAGDRVDVSFALYASQGEGREAGGFGEGAVTPDSDWAWAAFEAPLREGRAERLEAPGPVQRIAVTWYRSGNATMSSNLRLRLGAIADKLLLRRRATAALIVSAEQRPERPARRAVERFVAATGDPGAWMDRVAANR